MTTINANLRKEMKGHYDLLKNHHQELLDRKKRGIDDPTYITNQLKFIKGRIEIYAGLLNGNIEMYDKGLERFKEYGLLLLDELADSKEETNLLILNSSHTETRRFDSNTLHQNNEAYRQFALFIQEKTNHYTSLRKHFISK